MSPPAPQHACWQCGADLAEWLETHSALKAPGGALVSPDPSPRSPTAREFLDFSALQNKCTEQEFELQKLSTDNETLSQKLSEAVDDRADHEKTASASQVELDAAHAKIKELQDTLDSINQKRVVDTTQLQTDMQRLAEKLIDETEKRGEVEHAKLLVEHELEDLSRCLFEEANKMVKDERSRSVQWEKRHAISARKVTELTQLVDFEREQCNELKIRLEEAIEDKEREVKLRRALQMDYEQSHPHASRTGITSPESSSGDNGEDPLADLSLLFSPRRSPTSPSQGFRESVISGGTNGSRDSTLYDLSSGPDGSGVGSYQFTLPVKTLGANAPLHLFTHLYLFADDMIFNEFSEFLTLRNEKAALASAYMKRCFAEDVEPCLRFGSSLVVSSGSNLMSWRHHRRLLSAVQANSLMIETIPYYASTALVKNPSDPLPASASPAARSVRLSAPMPSASRSWSATGYMSIFTASGPTDPSQSNSTPAVNGISPAPQGAAPPLTITVPTGRTQSSHPSPTTPQGTSPPAMITTVCSLCELAIEAKPLTTSFTLPLGPIQMAQEPLVYFRYRLDDDDPERRPLCHRCRQRLRSACDFYAYTRMISRGLLAQVGSWRTFAQLQRLRLNMAVSRLGAIAIETACGTETGSISTVTD
ncbi:hypothetical protein H4R33_000212 [Dimargaris cristalligena]|uniref:GDP/GTP exchange factor Sec2 N-terminal domain-containing protein n=1 Tax=Dimargaris cristalligena TaxID=215637 RepID=A0A4P9ZY34_9FUNG|nr:hypothetical protein H4R33_000212 [Dimargaris cristalligena]RKP38614.1 hypothetical protein BJ085DRAFT_33548 [Dimargaris cristalligena]|eukprot:RKP38614.1 hypothetical protein BJ085DRAFT_33548 [Dimargaris cristalligena]